MIDAPNPVNNPPSKKESATGHVIFMQKMGAPTWTPRDYASLAREGYMQNAVVYRCVRMIAEAAMAIPLLVYKDDEPEDKHPFYDLINYPNPFEGTGDLLDSLYSFLQIAGNSYMEFVQEGKYQELYVLRPDRMKVTIGERGWPSKYTYKVGNDDGVDYLVPNGREKQRPILHVKNFHPLNDVYGLSSIEPAAFSVDVHTEAGKYNQALLQNQARPSGCLVMGADKESDGSLTDDQFTRLKQQLEDKYSGPKNAGRPMLLEGGLDWKPMGMSPQDLEFVNGKNQAAREIALSFGIPPMLLGIPGDNTYANLKEAYVALYRQAVLPLVGKVAQGMSVFFRPTYGDDFKLWYDQNEIAGLSQEREDTWTRLNQSTFLSTNEKREAVNYEDVDGGDEVLVPSSMVPISMDLNSPEIDPATGLPVDPQLDPETGKPTKPKKPADKKPVPKK